MPKLDQRLKTVARQIRASTHVDVGSDHGNLLRALLLSGRVVRGIAIENKLQPFENSTHTLKGLNAEVRLGDGLAALDAGEAESLSICGMGGKNITLILKTHPERVPDRLVLQPNRRSDLVRIWALDAGFAVEDEQVLRGPQIFEILTLVRSQVEADAAYTGLDEEAALLFGPITLRRREPEFVAQLRAEAEYLSGFERLSRDSQHRLDIVQRVLRQ